MFSLQDFEGHWMAQIWQARDIDLHFQNQTKHGTTVVFKQMRVIHPQTNLRQGEDTTVWLSLSHYLQRRGCVTQLIQGLRENDKVGFIFISSQNTTFLSGSGCSPRFKIGWQYVF